MLSPPEYTRKHRDEVRSAVARESKTPAARAKKVAVRRMIEQLLANGVAVADIEAAVAKEHGASRKQVKANLQAVKNTWEKEEEERRPQHRLATQKRLHSHILNAAKRQSWTAVAQLEGLLSDIQGTKKPIEVQVNVEATQREALTLVLAQMTPERVFELAEQAKRMHALPTAAGPVIEVAAEEPSNAQPERTEALPG